MFIHLSHSHLLLFFLSIKIPPAPGVSELAKFGYVYQKRKKKGRKEKTEKCWVMQGNLVGDKL